MPLAKSYQTSFAQRFMQVRSAEFLYVLSALMPFSCIVLRKWQHFHLIIFVSALEFRHAILFLQPGYMKSTNSNNHKKIS